MNITLTSSRAPIGAKNNYHEKRKKGTSFDFIPKNALVCGRLFRLYPMYPIYLRDGEESNPGHQDQSHGVEPTADVGKDPQGKSELD